MNKNARKTEITPQTRIGALLESYPELEDVLVKLSPAFEKLRNPVLRNTIGKIATLEQVGKVGGIPIGVLVNELRQAAGLEMDLSVGESKQPGGEARPAWVQEDKIVRTFDARPMLEKGEHPVGAVLSDLKTLKTGNVYELIAPFLPVPLIDKAQELGFNSWSEETSEGTKTYFRRTE
jgi:uncharacterized protein (DUF2249 family)